VPPDLHSQEYRSWCRVTMVTWPGAELGSWELRGRGDPDLATLGHLVRLQLAAQRSGAHLVLTEMCSALATLLDLSGLGEALSWEICAAGQRPGSPTD
jgi:ABC-type transporter Mla MlaB component